MNIPSMSMAMSASTTKTNVNIALMVKAKEQIQENAKDLMKVMEGTAVSPEKGQILDVKL